jgi:hypothetical protein
MFDFITREDFMKAKKALQANHFCLAPLSKTVPTPEYQPGCECWNTQGPTLGDILGCTKQEGKTPMRYNDNYASASATVAAQPSDTAVTRDYLLTRLAKADYPKEQALSKLFNLNAYNIPKTYQQMIDIIKAGTYTIDSKIAANLAASEANDDGDDGWYWGAMYGIVWPGPQPDKKGYAAAIEQKRTQYTAAKDTIMVGSAVEGLAALQAFEAWLPTPATTTVN